MSRGRSVGRPPGRSVGRPTPPPFPPTPAQSEPEAIRSAVSFCRFNQYPEYNVAKHEERERMAEEARFGGVKAGDKSDVACYGENDSVFIVENFAPERRLETPAEFIARLETPAPQIVVLVSLGGGGSAASGHSRPIRIRDHRTPLRTLMGTSQLL